VRDYIYMGGKLIAEYRPQENAYLYYATDQIGSTRIVTDDTGAVVYAAAHDPWGGIQKTWTNAYDPALKFSGKERDTESGLDYFGARYYDHSLVPLPERGSGDFADTGHGQCAVLEFIFLLRKQSN
jgi:hypothetical protein